MAEQARTNKEIVLRWAESVVNRGELNVVDELFAEEFSWEMPFNPEPLHGPEAMKETVTAFRAAFPDLFIEVDEIVAEGEKVALSYLASGTNHGEMMGEPATAESAEWRVTHIFTLREGRIVSDATVLDRARIKEQLSQANDPAPA